jgi:RNA recognition motif-containing protein
MNIDITPEEAKTILYELREFDKSSLISKLQKVIDDAKPKEKDFDDCFVTGYNINKEKIDGYRDALPFKQDVRETTFRTSKQVDAVRALAQLTQWYGNLDDKDKVDKYFSEGEWTRYKIGVRPNIDREALTDLVILKGSNYYGFLCFNNEQAAQDFLNNHREILNQAKYFL